MQNPIEPTDIYRSLFGGTRSNPNWLAAAVAESFRHIHRLKMVTDEPEISAKCQELINMLFDKYPNLVACRE